MRSQTKTTPPHYEFCVYIAGHTRRTDQAVENLRKICDKSLPARDCKIRVIDLTKNPDLARDLQIVATPAVLRTLPTPILKSIGDLSNGDRILLGLDLLTPLKSRQPSRKNTRKVRMPQAAD